MKTHVIVGLLLFVGCDQNPSPILIITTPEAPRSQFAGKLMQCAEAEAETVLELFVSVRDEFQRRAIIIPLRTGRDNDWMQSSGSFCEVGPDGGFSGGVRVVPSDEEVRLNCVLQYSSASGNGKIDRHVVATPGVEGVANFADDWLLEWRWRDPRKMEPTH